MVSLGIPVQKDQFMDEGRCSGPIVSLALCDFVQGCDHPSHGGTPSNWHTASNLMEGQLDAMHELIGIVTRSVDVVYHSDQDDVHVPGDPIANSSGGSIPCCELRRVSGGAGMVMSINRSRFQVARVRPISFTQYSNLVKWVN